MAQAASLWVKLGLSDKEFSDGLKRAENQMKRFGDRMSSLGSRITMGFSLPLGLASVGVVKLAADLEQTKIAFEVMTGSAKKAGEMVDSLQKMAAKTPYESKDLLESAKTLMLFGVESDKVRGSLQMLGDVASGNSEKLRALTLAFAQVQSTGRLTGQDLLQMVNAGFNPLQIISEKTGKSMADLKDQMSKGGISAQMVTDAFRAATSEGGRFFGMMDKQSQTTLGKFSTLMDNTKMALTNLGTALLPFANKLMEMFIPLTERLGALSDSFSRLPEPVKNITVGIVAFTVVLGPLLLVIGKVVTATSALLGVMRMIPTLGLVTFFTNYTTAIGAAATGSKAAASALSFMNGTILQSAAAIGGLIAVVWALKVAMDSFKDLKVSLMNPEDIKNITDVNKAYQVQASLRKEIARIEGEIKKMETGGGLYGLKRKLGLNEEDLKLYNAQLKDLKDNQKAVTEVIGNLSKVELPEIKIPGFDFSGVEGANQKTIEADPLKENIKVVEDWSDKVQNIVEDTGRGMEQSLGNTFFDAAKGNFDNLGDYFQSFCDSILRSWTNTMAQMATQKMMSGGIGNWMSGMLGGNSGLGGVVGDFPTTSNFGGYAATGGPVSGGKSYIVGERGPELFTPSSSGNITPNNALGGNVTVNVVNQTGVQARVKEQPVRFDGKQYVKTIILEAAANDPSFLAAIQGAR